MIMRAPGACVLTACLAALACTVQDSVAIFPDPAATADGGAPGDAQDRDTYCAGQGPPVLAGDGHGGSDICAGELAAQTFRHALCACEELVANNTFTTDAFDSRNGAYQPGTNQDTTNGAVGINGKLEATAPVDIGGTLTVAGDLGINAAPTLTVAGDLLDRGPLGGATATATVGGNARVGSDVRLTDFTVGNTLTLPAGAALEVSGQRDIGVEQRAPIDVALPCACAPAALIDIGGYVEAHRADNHNADIGLDSEQLVGFAADTTLALPCGRFFLGRVQSDTGSLTIEVGGRTALFIGQGITLGRSLHVDVLPGAELDLFVAGNVNIAGDVRLGAPARPGQVRVYVGGAGAINLSAQSTLGGNLYAPLMDLALAARTEIFGAVFVHKLLHADAVTIHYDTSVRAAAADCTDPIRRQIRAP